MGVASRTWGLPFHIRKNGCIYRCWLCLETGAISILDEERYSFSDMILMIEADSDTSDE